MVIDANGAHNRPCVLYCHTMSEIDSIDHQISRLCAEFDAAQEEETKLTAIEQGLADVELRFWLTQSKNAAIFCVELDRLRAHLRAEPSSEGSTLLESGLSQLRTSRDPGAKSSLLRTVNEMRELRGKPRLERANTLVQAQRSLWREMQRRTNIPRRLSRHLATITDLLESAHDPEKCQRALPLLGREADALHRLFRLDASSVIWGSLRRLCLLAAQANNPLTLPHLKDYCRSLQGPSDEARSLFATWPVLVEISEQMQPLDPAHPLPGLMKTPLEEFQRDAVDEPSHFSDSQETLEGDTPPTPSEERPPLAATIQADHLGKPHSQIPVPSEVDSLSRATDNLAQHLSEGVLGQTPTLRAIEDLAQRVLGAYAERQEPVAHFTQALEHLCELVDLAASGVQISEAELKSLASELEGLVTRPQVLNQIDQTLDALSSLRKRLATRESGALDASLDPQELERLTSAVEHIEASQRETDAPNPSRLFGFLLRRGELHYAIEQKDGTEMKCTDGEDENPQTEGYPLHALEEFFPQSGTLPPPATRLLLAQNGARLAIACDAITGPVWLDLRSPSEKPQGLAYLDDGRSLCVLSVEILLADCR